MPKAEYFSKKTCRIILLFQGLNPCLCSQFQIWSPLKFFFLNILLVVSFYALFFFSLFLLKFPFLFPSLDIMQEVVEFPESGVQTVVNLSLEFIRGLLFTQIQ